MSLLHSVAVCFTTLIVLSNIVVHIMAVSFSLFDFVNHALLHL